MKYKKYQWKLYKCVKPLTLKHLYTLPDEATIKPGEIWWLVSDNKSKKSVTLERVSDYAFQTRCKISFECFGEYFEEAEE